MTDQEKPGGWQVRTYGDGCVAAHALDLIGERWALLIVRELLFGPKRFSDLQIGLPLASPNVLTQRLRELTEAGIVKRAKLGAPARVWVYELTEWGHALKPVLVQLWRWGSQSPFFAPNGDLSVDSLLLALESRFDPTKAQDLTATLAVILDEDTFSVDIADGRLEITRGLPHEPDLTIRTNPIAFRSLVIHGHRPVHLTVHDPHGIFDRLLDAIH